MLDDKTEALLFRAARTHNVWLDKPVPEELLRRIHDLMKWGPTAQNCQPMRILLLRSREAKERLMPALNPGNREKVMRAPLTALISYDPRFYENLPRTFPNNPNAKAMYEGEEKKASTERAALRNSALQGAYFLIAARAHGLDCGPMSGFDNAKVDAEFFPNGRWKSNFLINLGYGDASKLSPRNPRLDFDEVCRTV